MLKRIQLLPFARMSLHASRPYAQWLFLISRRRTFLLQSEIAATVVAVFVALGIWANKAHDAFTLAFLFAHLFWFLVLPLLWLILAHANDYYSLRVITNLSSSITRLAWVALELFAIYLVIFFLSPRNSLPRGFILYYSAISITFLGLLRLCRFLLIHWLGIRRRALIAGTGSASQIIWEAIKKEARRDYEIVGCVTSVYDGRSAALQTTVLGTGAELPHIIQKYNISDLIVAYVNEIPDDVFKGLMVCYGQGVEILPMPILYEEITGRIPIELVGGHLWSLVLPFGEHPFLFHVYQACKRIIDIAFSLIGLVLFAPFLPMLALAIKLDSPGPIFYYQNRSGQGGKVFRIVKLRSMIHRAESTTGPCWATAYDQRVTRLGKILRKTRVDEVPQLINVLAGQMSLVGPRPERPEFTNQLTKEIPFYQTRLTIKPGLTGWAQVRYHYGNTTRDALIKLQYDLYYIRHQSLMLDLIIMVKTLGTMMLFQGV